MKDYISSKYCENCGSLIVEKYGSGRFCCEKCARSFSTKAKRKEINEKVSLKMKENYENEDFKEKYAKYNFNNLQIREKAKLNHKKYIEKTFGKWEDRKVRAFYGKCRVKFKEFNELDITNGELKEYRKTHQVCEICGKPEKVSTSPYGKISNLAVDHNHKTNHFRGLLCCDCNRKLGWYENLSADIIRYLREKDGPLE